MNGDRYGTHFLFATLLLVSGLAHCDEIPLEAETAIIAGRVIDGSGTPQPNTKVILRAFDSPGEPFGHYLPLGESIETDMNGRYQFPELPKNYYVIEASAAGMAKTFVSRNIESGQIETDVDLILLPAVKLMFEVRDEQGRPIEGARLRTLRRNSQNGLDSISQTDWTDMGMIIPASDQAGWMTLPYLSADERIYLSFEHSQYAPSRIENLTTSDGLVTSVVMKPGVPLRVRISPTMDGKTLNYVLLSLHSEQQESASNIHDYELPLNEEGVGTIVIEPGSYISLTLRHKNYFITPGLFREHEGQLQFRDERGSDLHFQTHQRTIARGRVIDAESGMPIAGESVSGEIVLPDHLKPQNIGTMNWTGMVDTNKNGEYQLPVAIGNGRVELMAERKIAEEEYTYFTAVPGQPTIIPDIKVRKLPIFRGTVRHQDGSPASKAVVRIRGNRPRGNYVADPVLTDDEGRFELQPRFWLGKFPTVPDFEPVIAAFDPYRPLSGAVPITLKDQQPVEIRLEPHELDWTLAEFPAEQTAWPRGIITPAEAASYQKISLLNQPAPEIDAVGWINSARLTSSDLRGHYVLLNFWFIGCGACHEDFPSMELIHELYKDHGLITIGIHSNANPLPAVEKHVAKEGLLFPIAVDQPEGTTVARYSEHGIAHRFPSYVLIDPAGKVILDDTTIPHPHLRGYKIEIIRNLLGKSGRLESASTTR